MRDLVLSHVSIFSFTHFLVVRETIVQAAFAAPARLGPTPSRRPSGTKEGHVSDDASGSFGVEEPSSSFDACSHKAARTNPRGALAAVEESSSKHEL